MIKWNWNFNSSREKHTWVDTAGKFIQELGLHSHILTLPHESCHKVNWHWKKKKKKDKVMQYPLWHNGAVCKVRTHNIIKQHVACKIYQNSFISVNYKTFRTWFYQHYSDWSAWNSEYLTTRKQLILLFRISHVMGLSSAEKAHTRNFCQAWL